MAGRPGVMQIYGGVYPTFDVLPSVIVDRESTEARRPKTQPAGLRSGDEDLQRRPTEVGAKEMADWSDPRDRNELCREWVSGSQPSGYGYLS